jgi:hypothetical protein
MIDDRSAGRGTSENSTRFAGHVTLEETRSKMMNIMIREFNRIRHFRLTLFSCQYINISYKKEEKRWVYEA